MAQKSKLIETEDITRYRIPSHLLYSPDGGRLAFEVTRADLEKNEYHTDVYVAEDGNARRVTWSIDAHIVTWADGETLILQRSLPDAQPGVTELFRLNLGGGEAEPWITLPFGLRRMEKAGDGFVAVGGIKGAYNLRRLMPGESVWVDILDKSIK